MKDNSFAQYISKQKIKGNYTSELDESKIGDFFKKDWYNTKKHLSGNLKDDEIELYRVTGDFNDKAFRESIVSKCIKAVEVEEKAKEAAKHSDETTEPMTGVSKLGKLEEIDPEKLQELAKPTIQETIKKIINQVVGLARGGNSNYDTNDEKQEKDDVLYAGGSKGYKYSWVQKDKLYIYFDSEKAARDFVREDLKEQKHFEVDESVISKMFSIEKCIRNKSKVYDKIKTEERHYKAESPIPHDKFDEECSKIIFDNIKDDLIKTAKSNRYGKKVPVGRITWSWSEDEIKEFLTQCVKSGVKDVNGIKSKIEEVFKSVTDAAEEAGHFLYAKGTAKGNVNLNFETLEDAENFKEEFEDAADYGALSAAADGKANSKFIDKAKSGNKEIKAAKLFAKIVKMAAENFDQIKVTEEEAAAAEAKLNKEGKSVETYSVTMSLNKERLNEAIETFIKENGGEAVEAGQLLDYLSANGGAVDKLLANIEEFCYSDAQRDGSVILHFETERAAAKFISEYNGSYDHAVFELTDPEKSSVNSKTIEEFKNDGKKVKQNKIDRAIMDNIDSKYKKYIKGLDDAAKEGIVYEIQIFPNMDMLTTKIEEEGPSFLNKLIHNGSALQESIIRAFNKVFEPIILSLNEADTQLTPEQKAAFNAAKKAFKAKFHRDPAETTEKTMIKKSINTPAKQVETAPDKVGETIADKVDNTPAEDTSTKKMGPNELLKTLKLAISAGIEKLNTLKTLKDNNNAAVKEFNNGIVIRFNGVDKETVDNVEAEIKEKFIAKDFFTIKQHKANYKIK